MKTIAFFLFLTFCSFGLQAQDIRDVKISVSLKNKPLKEVFNDLEKISGFEFGYKDSDLQHLSNVTYKANNESFYTVLNSILKPRHLIFFQSKKTILVTQEKSNKSTALGQKDTSLDKDLRGIVVDSLGNPIGDAFVSIKDMKKFYRTESNGTFELQNIPANSILIINRVGYTTKEIADLDFNNEIRIVLRSSNINLEDVTVNTGMFTRDKKTFTGATASYSGDQLRQIGVQNVLQSLKTLDPSFLQVANTLRGSDPNTLGNFQVRGQSGVSTSLSTNTSTLSNIYKTDPNQPLFILNGMQSTLQQITDLDIMRIASVTVLRDAASTALYGDKAANGVVVVETIKPKQGQVSVNYTMNGSVGFVDLSSYNFMNAAQNYQFQTLTGILSPWASNSIYALDSISNARKAQVLAGVDNNWLKVPIRNTFTQAHSLSINGGDPSFQYGIDLNYRSTPGLMKESQRQSYGATINLQYRHNKLNISNSLYINGFKATESPWGDYTQYAQISPLFNIYDSLGNYNKSPYLFTDIRTAYPSLSLIYLSSALMQNIPNPIYNATLHSFNYNNQSGYTNNFRLIYDILPNIRFQTGFQLAINKSNNANYDDPLSTDFLNVASVLKGSYTGIASNNNMYEGNAMLTFNKVYKNVHSVNANLRTDISYSKSNSTAFTAIGFPKVDKFSLANAYGYSTDGRPSFLENVSAEIQNVFSLNYAYDQRYLFDFTFNQDGTSNFGSNKLYKTFTSVGLGWNIHNEQFLSSIKDKLTLLRLRGNLGTSGNQSLGSYPSNSIYSIISGSNPFGLSYSLSQLGTPNLDWQTTRQISVGVDYDLFKHFISGYFELYNKLTDPLLVNATLPPSSGVSVNPFNVGKLSTKGLDFSLNISPIYDIQKRRIWTIGLTGSSIKSRYRDIGDKLSYQNSLNTDEIKGSAGITTSSTTTIVSADNFIRFKDGNDPNAIWAVRSLGIDPITGTEMFLSKDGSKTFKYNIADEVAIGSSQPVMQGVVSNTVQLGAFSFNVSLRYSIKATSVNYGLYNYAENISSYQYQNNQDIRTLDRWQKIGDISPFASLPAVANIVSHPLSSRFVNKESFISGESFNVGYQLLDRNNKLLKAIHAKTLRFNLYMNDIFYASNIKLERGINYPYSKSVSFSLSASF